MDFLRKRETVLQEKYISFVTLEMEVYIREKILKPTKKKKSSYALGPGIPHTVISEGAGGENTIKTEPPHRNYSSRNFCRRCREYSLLATQWLKKEGGDK